MRHTKTFIIFTLLLSIGAVSKSALSQEVRIGLASNFSEVSLSTSNPYGDYFRKGVNLALKDAEPALKKRGIKIAFDEFDYGTNQLRVTDAAKKAASSSVLAVLGYNLSPHALLAAPIHQAAKLAMITPSATANRLAGMGPYVHMGSFDNDFMGATLARVANEKVKAKRAAIVVAEDCAYCHDLADAFERDFKASGGEITARVGVLESQRDFSEAAKELKKKNTDVILVPNYELVSIRIISALIDGGINRPFLGGDGWGDIGEEFYKVLGGKDLRGFSVSHWHPDLKTKASISFSKRFEGAYHVQANDTAVLAYDSANLLFQAIIKTKNLTREGVEKSLSQITHFNGATGTFRYRSGSAAPEKSIVLLSTNKTRFQVAEVLEPRSVKNRGTK